MSTDELRRLLDYPDDELHSLDLPAIVARAERHRFRRRMSAAAGVAAVVVIGAAVVGAASMLGTGSRDQVQSHVPAATGIAPPSEPVTSTAPASADAGPMLYEASTGEHIDMGHGWQVWVDEGSVCRSETTGTGTAAETIEPFGCRSTTDGNIGGVGIQSSGGPDGTMYSAVIPYDAARVDVVTGEQRRPAQLVTFPELPGWTFYYLWSSDNYEASGRAVAYDSAGKRLVP